MYESSCSYQSALDLKRVTSGCPAAVPIKSEDCMSVGVASTGDWAGCAYRFACNSSTFEQLKQSVEKAKAALQDRGSYLAASSAFSDLATAATSPFAPPPRSTTTSHDPLQDSRRDDNITSGNDKRNHSHQSEPLSLGGFRRQRSAIMAALASGAPTITRAVPLDS